MSTIFNLAEKALFTPALVFNFVVIILININTVIKAIFAILLFAQIHFLNSPVLNSHNHNNTLSSYVYQEIILNFHI